MTSGETVTGRAIAVVATRLRSAAPNVDFPWTTGEQPVSVRQTGDRAPEDTAVLGLACEAGVTPWRRPGRDHGVTHARTTLVFVPVYTAAADEATDLRLSISVNPPGQVVGRHFSAGLCLHLAGAPSLHGLGVRYGLVEAPENTLGTGQFGSDGSAALSAQLTAAQARIMSEQTPAWWFRVFSTDGVGWLQEAQQNWRRTIESMFDELLRFGRSILRRHGEGREAVQDDIFQEAVVHVCEKYPPNADEPREIRRCFARALVQALSDHRREERRRHETTGAGWATIVARDVQEPSSEAEAKERVLEEIKEYIAGRGSGEHQAFCSTYLECLLTGKKHGICREEACRAAGVSRASFFRTYRQKWEVPFLAFLWNVARVE